MFAAGARIRRLQLRAEKLLTAKGAKKIRKGRKENLMAEGFASTAGFATTTTLFDLL
jgi:hypothetical protein